LRSRGRELARQSLRCRPRGARGTQTPSGHKYHPSAPSGMPWPPARSRAEHAGGGTEVKEKRTKRGPHLTPAEARKAGTPRHVAVRNARTHIMTTGACAWWSSGCRPDETAGQERRHAPSISGCWSTTAVSQDMALWHTRTRQADTPEHTQQHGSVRARGLRADTRSGRHTCEKRNKPAQPEAPKTRPECVPP
jgi:hypothetical protein